MKKLKEYIGYFLAVAAFITLFIQMGENKARNEMRDDEYKKQIESLKQNIQELTVELKETNLLLYDHQGTLGKIIGLLE